MKEHRGSSISIDQLRERIQRIQCLEGGSSRASATLPFAVPEIDRHLPGRGLALGAVHEVAGGGNGALDGAAAALFTAGIAARTTGKIFWCVSRFDRFVPALAQVGLGPNRVIFVECRDEQGVLDCMEECLRCRGLGAVVGEVVRFSMTASRRLQLAAESAGTIGVYGRIRREGEVVHLVAHRLTDLSAELASVGSRNDAFPLPHGRGDELHQRAPAPDPRGLPKARDLADQYSHIDRLRIRTRDFR